MFLLILQRKEERKKKHRCVSESNIGWLSLICTQTGNQTTTPACALTGNQTLTLLVNRTMLQLTDPPTGQIYWPR